LGTIKNYVLHDNTTQSPKKRNGWRLFLWILFVSLIVLLVVGEVILRRAAPILKGRIIETLSTRFNSHVELDDLQVSLVKGLAVSGNGLRIFAPDDVVAAGAKAPIIAVQRFEFHASLIGFFLKPTHVGAVHVQGLVINIPPKSMRQNGKASQHRGKIKILVDELVCDDSRLVIGTDKPDRDPKVFVLQHIVLKNVGPNAPSRYDATLINAIPKGDIHAVGTFGPWDTEAPGESTVTGKYTFQHADLNTIKGIGGTLHSVGDFTGRLDRIEVQGIADVPDFTLDTANHPVPLHIKGQGHTIDLDVDVPAGRIQDFLQLAVKTQPAVMTGVLAMKTKLHIRPGKESVTQKLGLKGTFGLKQIHFSNPDVQDKVDMLSLRAEGHPKEAKPGAEDVTSRMTGRFLMGDGKLTLQALEYTLPGATVQLQGVYTLDGKKFDFTGKVRTQAKLSQMVASRWKSWALKIADPFFHKHGAGAEIPVKVTGTNTAPKFGLDIGHKDKKSD
jgi:hypothetical protein